MKELILLPNNKPEVKKWTPTPRQAEVLRRTRPTMRWLWRLSAEEMAPYAGHWVAAQDSRIIASSVKRDELEAAIAHLDRETVVVHKIENRWMIRR